MLRENVNSSRPRDHVIIWTNAYLLSMWILGDKFQLILSQNETFSLQEKLIWKYHLQYIDHLVSASVIWYTMYKQISQLRRWEWYNSTQYPTGHGPLHRPWNLSGAPFTKMDKL